MVLERPQLLEEGTSNSQGLHGKPQLKDTVLTAEPTAAKLLRCQKVSPSSFAFIGRLIQLNGQKNPCKPEDLVVHDDCL